MIHFKMSFVIFDWINKQLKKSGANLQINFVFQDRKLFVTFQRKNKI